MSILSNPIFHDDAAAYAYLEAILWPSGPVCPHCGGMERNGVLKGGRPGLRKCYHCRKQFTVTVGTVFESSHIRLHKWLQATYLLCSSKKGISSHQLHRILQVTYKTAWFMSHRIREAMRQGQDFGPVGGAGQPVEVDETFIGGERRGRGKGGGVGHKDKVLALVERGGRVRSFHVASVKQSTLRPILREQIVASATVYTDEASYHRSLSKDFAKHETVNHRLDEYVRGDVSTNTIEGYFSILKRGIGGIYQHVSPEHLKRYICEFDFRYNEREALGVDDKARTVAALAGIKGKRLTYRWTHKQERTL